mgnify:CR=1 FL=1
MKPQSFNDSFTNEFNLKTSVKVIFDTINPRYFIVKTTVRMPHDDGIRQRLALKNKCFSIDKWDAFILDLNKRKQPK